MPLSIRKINDNILLTTANEESAVPPKDQFLFVMIDGSPAIAFVLIQNAKDIPSHSGSHTVFVWIFFS